MIRNELGPFNKVFIFPFHRQKFENRLLKTHAIIRFSVDHNCAGLKLYISNFFFASELELSVLARNFNFSAFDG